MGSARTTALETGKAQFPERPQTTAKPRTRVCARQSYVDVHSVLLTERMLVDIDIRAEVRGQLQFPGDLYLEVSVCFVHCPI